MELVVQTNNNNKKEYSVGCLNSHCLRKKFWGVTGFPIVMELWGALNALLWQEELKDMRKQEE